LKQFYLTPFHPEQDFYVQFEQRLANACNLFGIGTGCS